MKKILAILMAVILVVGMVACSSNASTPAADTSSADTSATTNTTDETKTEDTAKDEAKTLKIGVCLDTIDSDFWVSTVASLEACAKENNVEMIQRLCEGDANKQNQQVEDLIAQGADAIIIGARDGAAIVAAVKKCNDAGVPTVMLSRAVMGEDVLPSLQVLVDNISLAEGTMEWIAKKGQDEGHVYKTVLLVGSLGDQNALERQQGHKAILDKYPDVFDVVAEIPTDWKPEQAYAGLQNAYEKDPDIDLIITPSDALLTTIKSVLEPMGKWVPADDPAHVNIVTFDGDKTFAEMMDQGYVDCGAVNDTRFMGEESMTWAIKLTNGEKPSELNSLDPGIVATRDNWDEVKDDIWGYVAYQNG